MLDQDSLSELGKLRVQELKKLIEGKYSGKPTTKAEPIKTSNDSIRSHLIEARRIIAHLDDNQVNKAITHINAAISSLSLIQ